MSDALVASTGELLSADVSHETLRTYANARVARDAATADKAMILRDLDHEGLRAAERQIAEAELVIAAVEEQLAEAFSEDVRRQTAQPITLDIGCVRVTWGKPRERWAQDVSPKQIAKRDPDLARELGIRRETGSPPKPRITVRFEEL